MSRYVVGIDLGTTNTAVAYIDTEVEDGEVQALAIPQVVAPGDVAAQDTLPSFLLLPTEHEVDPASLALPWDPSPGFAVGTFARDRGAELPQRVVASAKSWLSHHGADRKAPILPWRGADAEPEAGAQRVSPVEASARYLRHVRAAWDLTMETPLAEQDVLLAVPASFDAAARELTALAAHEAGLDKVTLLEEPQAAFYSWLAEAGDGWRDRLTAGDIVLVCDIGGGTTDFTLIEVIDEQGNLALERVAVGDHILLGGDNMDLALAHVVTQKLGDKGKKLGPMQRRALVHACRRAKEQLLSEDPPDEVPITILGSGSKLIGGTLKSTLTRDEAHALVLDGFFPRVEHEDAPQARKAVGLVELGLPYAHDPAVTRHLAAFTRRHGKEPTAILWNGGVMKATAIRARIAQNLAQWHRGARLPTLGDTNLDLAVSTGVAYYGLVRRGRGIRIRGGTARSYYIGVESAMLAIPVFPPPVKAVCVAPFGMEEGSSASVSGEELGLVVGETAEFRFFASTARSEDVVGGVMDPDEAELSELDPVEAELPPGEGMDAGQVVPVTLEAKVTEVGTLELWCVASGGQGRWKLEYSVRESE